MTQKVDRAEICLLQWIQRAAGREPALVWAQWAADTADALEAHRQRQAELRQLVIDARFKLLDHDLGGVRECLVAMDKILN